MEYYTEEELRNLPGLAYENKGKSNLVFIEKGCVFVRATIQLEGDSTLLVIRRGYMSLSLRVWSGSVVWIGGGCYFNDVDPYLIPKVYVQEHTNFIVGNGSIFGLNVSCRTSDSHVIYDANTGMRVNKSRSIYVGDHVWVAQCATLLKGAQVGSGAIVGSYCVVPRKKVLSNTIVAGTPSREVRKDVFFTSDCCNAYTREDTREKAVYENRDFVFKSKTDDAFDKMETALERLSTPQERYDYLAAIMDDFSNHNRFALGKRRTILSRLMSKLRGRKN